MFIDDITMTSHADALSRGGVLEPEGTVEIKYKRKDVLKTIARLDPAYADLLSKSMSPGGCLFTF